MSAIESITFCAWTECTKSTIVRNTEFTLFIIIELLHVNVKEAFKNKKVVIWMNYFVFMLNQNNKTMYHVHFTFALIHTKNKQTNKQANN